MRLCPFCASVSFLKSQIIRDNELFFLDWITLWVCQENTTHHHQSLGDIGIDSQPDMWSRASSLFEQMSGRGWALSRCDKFIKPAWFHLYLDMKRDHFIN